MFENKQDNTIDSLSNILDGLKIVEKRPTAQFFKNKELQNLERSDLPQKFHSHRNEKYNSKAKENQPIKTVFR